MKYKLFLFFKYLCIDLSIKDQHSRQINYEYFCEDIVNYGEDKRNVETFCKQIIYGCYGFSYTICAN